ncbi:hypothetical protein BDQ17DRAFT_377967 [Cyathus striatus]|nr:hypothetical protein BDQ17DRAFT_377967 [Cyathus striatus]
MARTSRPTPSTTTTTTTTRHDSPPPSPLSAPSPSNSHSTVDDEISSLSATPNGSQALGSASRAGTPPYKLHPETLESDDSVTCQWDDCGIVYRHLPSLIDHIHNARRNDLVTPFTCSGIDVPLVFSASFSPCKSPSIPF